ncbi:MAG TPA: hypothetical protein VF505_19520 [Thermoanaerobaculia bacterium]
MTLFRSHNSGRLLHFATATILALAVAGNLFAEDFYEQQLRLAKVDVAAGRQSQALDELRVAAFGFLDRPALLSEALVRVATLQNAMGRPADFMVTLNRFMEVERRFGSYSSAALEPELRSKFEALLLSSVPRNEILSLPALARLIRSDASRVLDLIPDKRAAAFDQGFRRSPRDIEWPLTAATDAASRALDQDTILWSRRALTIDNGNARARVLLTHALAHRGDCREALTQMASLSESDFAAASDLTGDRLVCLVKEARWNDAETASAKLADSVRERSDVRGALTTVRDRRAPVVRPPQTTTTSAPPTTTAAPPMTKPGSDQALANSKSLVRNGRFADAAKVLETAVAADPSRRDLRMALLEAAALTRNWRVAVAQSAAVNPFLAGEEASMFYAASALYETGRKDEARQLMQRARPKLVSTPLVDYYSRLVLGSPASR